VHIQKASSVVSESNILLHTFDPTDSVKTKSREVYLGRLGVHEEINIVFRNDMNDFVEDVQIPVICLRSDTVQPELSLYDSGVELKVLFVLDKVVHLETDSHGTMQRTKFTPSLRAYQVIRSGVIAAAQSHQFLTGGLDALTGTVQYALDSSRFVLKVGYDLTTDFLVNVDVLLGEGCQMVDNQLDGARNVLLDSLLHLTRRLHQHLAVVDGLVSDKIRQVLQHLRPFLSRIMKLLHPYLSLALYLTGPAWSLMMPYMEPFAHRAYTVHEGLQQNFLVGPIVSSVTNRALEVMDDTLEIYQALEEENKAKKQ